MSTMGSEQVQSELRVITPLTGDLDADSFYARVELADGTELGLVPRLGGAVAITAGPASRWTGYADEWMYEDTKRAGVEFALFAGGLRDAPDRWTRHVSAGKRTVRRRVCRQCGRVAETTDDEDGCALPPPACDHGGEANAS